MRETKSPSEALLDAALDAAQEQTEGGISEFRAHAVYARIKGELGPRPMARWPIFAGAAIAAVIAVVVWFPRPEPIATPLAPIQIADVVFRSDGVRVAAGDDLLASDATEVAAGARMELDERARVDLDVRGEAKVAVFGPAEVARADDGSIRMKKGRASFSVAPHPKERPYVVQVGPDRVIVHGTKFDVHARGGRLDRVDVAEGKVEVQRQGEAPRMLIRGESYAADDAMPPADAASFDAPWWRTVETTGYLLVETRPSGAEVSIDGVAIGRSPLLVRWRTGESKVMLTMADERSKGSWEGSVSIRPNEVLRLKRTFGERQVEEPPPARPRSDPWKQARRLLKAKQCERLDRVVKQMAKTSDRQDAARAEMLGAECQLRRGKKEIALTRYLAIEKKHRDTTSAEAALFEAANLQADLGKKEALPSMELYLSRHPNGRFAEAAAIRRCELLVSADRLREGSECLERYRSEHPGGLRASQAILLLATIARIEGRWADAAGAYREYLSRTPSSQHAESARHHLIECLLRGKLDGADAAISDYLTQHPDGPHAEEVKRWQRASSH